MESIWQHHAEHLGELVNAKDELQAHLFLEQLMLFPVDIQDKIINDIASLGKCKTEDIEEILSYYASRV
ncbi:hypothetical protein [Thalassotalea aquiviva]|uniref:hypothetical protein n=1 Tax=Thalassotalea aquiviva TaxID=3242415 RepID=UPI00352B88F0